MSKYAALCNNLQTLDLVKIREMLDGVINKINSDKNYTLTDALLELTNAEIKFRDERARRVNIAISSFPYIKTIQDFDFSFQPDINKNKILDLVSLRFMENKSNIVFMGSPGVGKTHLATAIGVESASQRMSTYFINFAVLMEKLKIASQENNVEKIIRRYKNMLCLSLMRLGIFLSIRTHHMGSFSLLLQGMRRNQR